MERITHHVFTEEQLKECFNITTEHITCITTIPGCRILCVTGPCEQCKSCDKNRLYHCPGYDPGPEGCQNYFPKEVSDGLHVLW